VLNNNSITGLIPVAKMYNANVRLDGSTLLLDSRHVTINGI